MFKHEIKVDGSYLCGNVVKEGEHYAFKLTEYYPSGGSEFDSSSLRDFAIELNNIALEVDKLNGKNTLIR